MILPENVFEDWSVESILGYCKQHYLEYTTDDIYEIVTVFDKPPAGFISIGRIFQDHPYWSKEELEQDISILIEDGFDNVFGTLDLQHDEMCDFLDFLVQSLRKK